MSGVVRHLAVALAAGLLLTGCGQMADQATESMIEGATGADALALDSGSDISRIASFSADSKTVMVTAIGSDESGQITVLVTQNLE